MDRTRGLVDGGVLQDAQGTEMNLSVSLLVASALFAFTIVLPIMKPCRMAIMSHPLSTRARLVTRVALMAARLASLCVILVWVWICRELHLSQWPIIAGVAIGVVITWPAAVLITRTRQGR